MALTPEEERAQLWVVNQGKKRAFQAALQAKLKAPSAEANRQKRNWEPVKETR